MTWLNISARVLSLLVVLPLVLRQFGPADIALYYLFAGLISLQLMAGSGFIPTFSRAVAYVLAGARLQNLRFGGETPPDSVQAAPDIQLFMGVLATQRRIFRSLAVGTIPLMAGVGSCLLIRPISVSADPHHSWWAWAVIVATTPVVLLSCQYSAILQGANRIALDQRWGALFVVAGSVCGVLVLGTGGGLLSLVLVNQLWQIAGFFRLRHLSSQIVGEVCGGISANQSYQPDIFRVLWPASWRSLLGVLASAGVTAGSGLIFAQFLASKPLAELLFGIRIMGIIGDMSRAPFYSKIPLFNSLRYQGKITELCEVSCVSMRKAYFIFVALVLLAPVVAQFALPLIGSRIAFPAAGFWLIFGAAALVERLGAMHIQLYSTTNHIVWHWLNGITGLIWLGLMALLIPRWGQNAYPISMLMAYCGCYSWWALHYSLRSLRISFWNFERAGFMPAASAQLLGSLVLYSCLKR